jgi:alkylresorcinol/alkylpyrone synthase
VSRAPRLVALATATPPHVVRQEDARQLVARLFASVLDGDRERLLAVFDHSAIQRRHVCMPLEWFGEDHSFAEKNALYLEHAVRLAADVARRALDQAGLAPGDVDHLLFVSSTGLATPSVDARLANVVGFRAGLRRTPVWGLGCAGGAAGLARARDFALADPAARVLLVSLELCSLTFQRNDLSKRNLVAASLFADGAAAALVVGSEARPSALDGSHALELVAASSTLWPDTLDIMGWEEDGDGLHVVFSRDIPAFVRERVRPSLSTIGAR